MTIIYVHACPECGAQPWVNIDCSLCMYSSAMEDDVAALRDQLAQRDMGLVTYRWRGLVPEQREYVIDMLRRDRRRLMKCSERARGNAERPPPFDAAPKQAAMRHASRAGALGVLIEMLEEIGGHG